MLFVVFFNSYMCWIVGLSPLTWPGVGDLVLSHPHHLVCTVFALSCYCSPVVSVSDSASGFVCVCVCVCVCVHTCMHEHYVSCCLASGTFLTDSWSRDGSAPAGLKLNRLEVLLLPASPYCHTTVFHLSFQRRSVGCDMKMSICLCG